MFNIRRSRGQKLEKIKAWFFIIFISFYTIFLVLFFTISVHNLLSVWLSTKNVVVLPKKKKNTQKIPNEKEQKKDRRKNKNKATNKHWNKYENKNKKS